MFCCNKMGALTLTINKMEALQVVHKNAMKLFNVKEFYLI